MEKMKMKILIGSILILVSSGLVSGALEGYVVESGPQEVNNLIYKWGSADTTAYYQDAQAYPDVGLMICETSGTLDTDYFTGLVYSTGSSSELVSYGRDGTLSPADQDVTYNGNDCKMTSIGGLTVSPSSISGTPETKIAGMPAEAHVMISENSDGTDRQILETNSELKGSYSGNLNYDYSTNRLDLTVNGITVDSDIGTRSFSPGTTGRGITSERPLITGVCSDSSGDSCNGLSSVKTSSSFPETFDFDKSISEVNDQNVYTRYGIANGKVVDTVDIGADLEVRGLSTDRDPVYYSQNQTVSFSIRNTGNVPVTTGFDISSSIEKGGQVFDSRSFSIDSGLDVGESRSFSYDWKALNNSGRYSVNVEADTGNDVAEINEGNTDTDYFDLEAITYPDIYVDGERVPENEVEFDYPGVPYNLTFVMKDSDGTILSDSRIELVETDGFSSFVPTQEVTEGSFNSMRKISSFRTDENGTASITFIPTGNIFLSDRYNNTDVQSSVDYSITMTARHSGEQLNFIIDNSVTSNYPLEVGNPGLYQGEGNSSLPNIDNYVKPVMNGVYTIFAEFWGAVT